MPTEVVQPAGNVASNMARTAAPWMYSYENIAYLYGLYNNATFVSVCVYV